MACDQDLVSELSEHLLGRSETVRKLVNSAVWSLIREPSAAQSDTYALKSFILFQHRG